MLKIRLISVALVVSFLGQELAFASGDVGAQLIAPLHLADRKENHKAWARSVLPEIPFSVATIEDAWRAHEGQTRVRPSFDPPTVILIQDAHTNDSAQVNAAKVLDAILSKYPGTRHIFTEAALGNNSLSFLRDLAPLSKRKEVASSYIRKGLLHGVEYLDLTSNHPFILWGVEDPALYTQSLESYRKVAKTRDQYQNYLSRIESTIKTLKPRFFNPLLLAFDEKYHQQFDILSEQAQILNISLDKYPHLKALKDLKEFESKIDFKAANEEEQKAIESLSEEDQKELAGAGFKPAPTSRDPKIQGAFFALLEEKMRRGGFQTRPYPELFKYFDYLKRVSTIDPKKILEETQSLESKIFDALSVNDDERMFLKCQSRLETLKKLFGLTLTSEEFEEYKKTSQDFTITHLTGFLNKKIMNLGVYYERALFLEPGYDDIVQESENFYKLTYERDKVFMTKLFHKMRWDATGAAGDAGGEASSARRSPEATEDDGVPQAAGPAALQTAILITGGYHTPNLKALLKEQNISFISFTPQIFQETNQKRYESILLGQLNAASKLSPPNPALSTTMPTYGANVSGILPKIEFNHEVYGLALAKEVAPDAESQITANFNRLKNEQLIEAKLGGQTPSSPPVGSDPKSQAKVVGQEAESEGKEERISANADGDNIAQSSSPHKTLQTSVELIEKRTPSSYSLSLGSSINPAINNAANIAASKNRHLGDISLKKIVAKAAPLWTLAISIAVRASNFLRSLLNRIIYKLTRPRLVVKPPFQSNELITYPKGSVNAPSAVRPHHLPGRHSATDPEGIEQADGGARLAVVDEIKRAGAKLYDVTQILGFDKDNAYEIQLMKRYASEFIGESEPVRRYDNVLKLTTHLLLLMNQLVQIKESYNVSSSNPTRESLQSLSDEMGAVIFALNRIYTAMLMRRYEDLVGAAATLKGEYPLLPPGLPELDRSANLMREALIILQEVQQMLSVESENAGARLADELSHEKVEEYLMLLADVPMAKVLNVLDEKGYGFTADKFKGAVSLRFALRRSNDYFGTIPNLLYAAAVVKAEELGLPKNLIRRPDIGDYQGREEFSVIYDRWVIAPIRRQHYVKYLNTEAKFLEDQYRLWQMDNPTEEKAQELELSKIEFEDLASAFRIFMSTFDTYRQTLGKRELSWEEHWTFFKQGDGFLQRLSDLLNEAEGRDEARSYIRGLHVWTSIIMGAASGYAGEKPLAARLAGLWHLPFDTFYRGSNKGQTLMVGIRPGSDPRLTLVREGETAKVHRGARLAEIESHPEESEISRVAGGNRRGLSTLPEVVIENGTRAEVIEAILKGFDEGVFDVYTLLDADGITLTSKTHIRPLTREDFKARLETVLGEGERYKLFKGFRSVSEIPSLKPSRAIIVKRLKPEGARLALRLDDTDVSSRSGRALSASSGRAQPTPLVPSPSTSLGMVSLSNHEAEPSRGARLAGLRRTLGKIKRVTAKDHIKLSAESHPLNLSKKAYLDFIRAIREADENFTVPSTLAELSAFYYRLIEANIEFFRSLRKAESLTMVASWGLIKYLENDGYHPSDLVNLIDQVGAINIHPARLADGDSERLAELEQMLLEQDSLLSGDELIDYIRLAKHVRCISALHDPMELPEFPRIQFYPVVYDVIGNRHMLEIFLGGADTSLIHAVRAFAYDQSEEGSLSKLVFHLDDTVTDNLQAQEIQDALDARTAAAEKEWTIEGSIRYTDLQTYPYRKWKELYAIFEEINNNAPFNSYNREVSNREFMHELKNRSAQDILFIESQDGRDVGYAVLSLWASKMHPSLHMVVRSSPQGQAVAERLIRFVIQYATKEGAISLGDYIHLEATQVWRAWDALIKNGEVSIDQLALEAYVGQDVDNAIRIGNIRSKYIEPFLSWAVQRKLGNLPLDKYSGGVDITFALPQTAARLAAPADESASGGLADIKQNKVQKIREFKVQAIRKYLAQALRILEEEKELAKKDNQESVKNYPFETYIKRLNDILGSGNLEDWKVIKGALETNIAPFAPSVMTQLRPLFLGLANFNEHIEAQIRRETLGYTDPDILSKALKAIRTADPSGVSSDYVGERLGMTPSDWDGWIKKHPQARRRIMDAISFRRKARTAQPLVSNTDKIDPKSFEEFSKFIKSAQWVRDLFPELGRIQYEVLGENGKLFTISPKGRVFEIKNEKGERVQEIPFDWKWIILLKTKVAESKEKLGGARLALRRGQPSADLAQGYAPLVPSKSPEEATRRGARLASSKDKKVMELIKKLQDGAAEDRLSAADSLGKMGLVAKKAVPALVKALHDRNEEITFKAAKALGEIGAVQKGVVPALIDKMFWHWSDRHRFFSVLEAIFEKDPEAAKKAVPRLIEVVGSSIRMAHSHNLSLLWYAAGLLGKIGPDAKNAVEILSQAEKFLDHPRNQPHLKEYSKRVHKALRSMTARPHAARLASLWHLPFDTFYRGSNKGQTLMVGIRPGSDPRLTLVREGETAKVHRGARLAAQHYKPSGLWTQENIMRAMMALEDKGYLERHNSNFFKKNPKIKIPVRFSDVLQRKVSLSSIFRAAHNNILGGFYGAKILLPKFRDYLNGNLLVPPVPMDGRRNRFFGGMGARLALRHDDTDVSSRSGHAPLVPSPSTSLGIRGARLAVVGEIKRAGLRLYAVAQILGFDKDNAFEVNLLNRYGLEFIGQSEPVRRYDSVLKLTIHLLLLTSQLAQIKKRYDALESNPTRESLQSLSDEMGAVIFALNRIYVAMQLRLREDLIGAADASKGEYPLLPPRLPELAKSANLMHEALIVLQEVQQMLSVESENAGARLAAPAGESVSGGLAEVGNQKRLRTQGARLTLLRAQIKAFFAAIVIRVEALRSKQKQKDKASWIEEQFTSLGIRAIPDLLRIRSNSKASPASREGAEKLLRSEAMRRAGFDLAAHDRAVREYHEYTGNHSAEGNNHSDFPVAFFVYLLNVYGIKNPTIIDMVIGRPMNKIQWTKRFVTLIRGDLVERYAKGNRRELLRRMEILKSLATKNQTKVKSAEPAAPKKSEVVQGFLGIDRRGGVLIESKYETEKGRNVFSLKVQDPGSGAWKDFVLRIAAADLREKGKRIVVDRQDNRVFTVEVRDSRVVISGVEADRQTKVKFRLEKVSNDESKTVVESENLAFRIGRADSSDLDERERHKKWEGFLNYAAGGYLKEKTSSIHISDEEDVPIPVDGARLAASAAPEGLGTRMHALETGKLLVRELGSERLKLEPAIAGTLEGFVIGVEPEPGQSIAVSLVKTEPSILTFEPGPDAHSVKVNIAGRYYKTINTAEKIAPHAQAARLSQSDLINLLNAANKEDSAPLGTVPIEAYVFLDSYANLKGSADLLDSIIATGLLALVTRKANYKAIHLVGSADMVNQARAVIDATRALKMREHLFVGGAQQIHSDARQMVLSTKDYFLNHKAELLGKPGRRFVTLDNIEYDSQKRTIDIVAFNPIASLVEAIAAIEALDAQDSTFLAVYQYFKEKTGFFAITPAEFLDYIQGNPQAVQRFAFPPTIRAVDIGLALRAWATAARMAAQAA